MAYRRWVAFICVLFLSFLSACGDSHANGQLEGNWLLTGGRIDGEHKDVARGNGFVYRFQNGQFSMPCKGGLKDGQYSLGEMPYTRDGEKISLQGGGNLSFTISELDDQHLVLRPPYADRKHVVEFEFTRIDDATVSELSASAGE